MAKGINIAIGADTRAYADAVKRGMIDPTEQAADALKDLGKDGPRDLDRVEDAMRESQKATEKTRDEVDDLKDQLRDLGRKAKSDFARPMKDAANETSEAFDQIKDDGFSNAKEVAASFDGSAESIVDGFQGAAAEMFSGFGPLGAAAGLAAAVGLGAVTAALTAQQEEAEETKQALTDMYKEAIDEGRNYLSEAQILGAVTDLLLDTGKQEEFRKKAAEINVDVLTYTRAQAGSYEDLQLVIDAAKKADEERGSGAEVNSKQAQAAALEERNALARIIRENERLIEQHEANKMGAEAVAQAREDSEKRQREQINRTRDTDQARYEAAARSRGALASAPPVVVPVQFAEPDASAVRNSLQRKLRNLGPVRVDAEVYTRNGQPVF